MALMKKQYRSTIGAAEKVITAFDWVLEDWILLYDCYYAHGVTSPKLLLNGTDVTFQLTLLLSSHNSYSGSSAGHVKMTFSHEPKFLTMTFTVSVIRTSKNESKALLDHTFNNSASILVDLPLTGSMTNKGMLLENGALFLSIQFTMVKSVSISLFPHDTSDDSFKGSFRENLKTIFDSTSFYDVTFAIGDEKLFAHKVILAAKSEVFKAMFLSGMKEETENVIEIIDTDAKVFQEFLNYIYVGKVNDLEAIVDDMFFLADKYEISDLKSVCGNYMSAYLDTDNAVKYLLVAYKHCCETLKNKALELIKQNMRILKNESDYKLLGEYPTLIQEIFDQKFVNQ